jgi:hypothetical protein
MDIFERLGLDEVRTRRELSTLDWQSGLTPVDIASELPALPADLFGDLEDGDIFHSLDQFIAALLGKLDTAPPDMATEGALSLGGPAAYGEPTAGWMVPTRDSTGGITSWTEAPDTGGGAVRATGERGTGPAPGAEPAADDQQEEPLYPEEYLDDLP